MRITHIRCTGRKRNAMQVNGNKIIITHTQLFRLTECLRWLVSMDCLFCASSMCCVMWLFAFRPRSKSSMQEKKQLQSRWTSLQKTSKICSYQEYFFNIPESFLMAVWLRHGPRKNHRRRRLIVLIWMADVVWIYLCLNHILGSNLSFINTNYSGGLFYSINKRIQVAEQYYIFYHLLIYCTHCTMYILPRNSTGYGPRKRMQ